jgi:hypothetical protein
MDPKSYLGRKGKEGLIMENTIGKNIKTKLMQDLGPKIQDSDSAATVLDTVKKIPSDLPESEKVEATGAASAGGYSAPLFGDMKEDEETKNTETPNFYKSVFKEDDKSYIAAYKIIDDSSNKFIEVLNIQENEVGRMFFDKKETYVISIHKFRLPKSQIKILDDDTGFEGFKFIKIPYWLVKKDPQQYKIKRLNKKKRLANKYNYPVDDLLNKVDEDVVDYITQTDGDKESIRKIKIQKGEKITKAETKEATGSSSAGAYVGPAVWAKSSTKKNWRGARKTQLPGGKFVEVKKKCQKFPYCNQGDIKALNIFENDRIKQVIKNISKKHNISENVIKNILRYELDVFRKYKK